jgi:Lrp/AsnC family transcriptional regulator, leucine-responsive regulatory protein
MAIGRNIDEIDRAILALLQENARMTQTEVARAVGLAPSAVLERMRKLESRGAIRGYVALVDPHVLDQRMLAFVAVRTSAVGDDERRVAERLAAIPEVLEVHFVAGDDCLLLKMRARDAEHVGDLLRNHVGTVAGVRSTRTTIVLGSVKESPRIPVRMDSEGEEPAFAEAATGKPALVDATPGRPRGERS